jgi:GNAT superfamily N-acetyltransferase
LNFEFLTDNENAIPILANWYYQEWGYLNREVNLEKVIAKLHGYLNKNKIPLIILAVENDEILGACQLRFREMDIYPEKEHWLGAVYVADNHRGRGVAEKLIDKAVSVARELGVEKLYLQTPQLGGGLYSRLGWQPVERVNYHGLEVLVMDREIGA